MEFLLASAIGCLTAAGVYLTLRKRSFAVVLGMTLLSYATNLFLFVTGRLVIDQPPILQKGVESYTDPLPQALVLTAIVIGFAMTALLLDPCSTAGAAVEWALGVELPRRVGAVGGRGGQLEHLRPEGGEHDRRHGLLARRERPRHAAAPTHGLAIELRDEAAELRVHRRILHHHRRVLLQADLLQLAVVQREPLRGREVAGLPQRAPHVLPHLPGQPPPALRRHLLDLGVAEYKLPDRFRFVDALPLTPVGKIDKRRLRDSLAAPA